jgi:hypothetical protein
MQCPIDSLAFSSEAIAAHDQSNELVIKIDSGSTHGLIITAGH